MLRLLITFGTGGILFSGALSISDSVRPDNLVNTISQRPMKGSSPNFGHGCIWTHICADKILGPKGQGHSSQ